MTLPYSPSIATFMGNDVATEFPFHFKVWDKSHLQVSVVRPDGVVQAMPFTAVLTDTGGTVNLVHNGKPLPAGWRLSIVRNMPFEQRVDLVAGTRFDPQVIEDVLDVAAAERQQLRESLARAVIVPPGSAEAPDVVADKILRAAAEAVQAAVDAGESRLGAEEALVQVDVEKTQCLEEFERAGTEQVTRIEREGQVQWERVVAGTAALDANIAQGVATVLRTGDEQALRVEGVGANQVYLAAQQAGRALQEANRAESEADRAEEYANAARDLSLGELPQASENFLGLAQLATKAEAEAGLDHTKVMTPLRTAQAIRTLQPVVVEPPVINGPDSTREGAVEHFVFASRSVLPDTQVTAFVYSVDLTGEETRVVAVSDEDGTASATVPLIFGGILGEENSLSVYAVDNLGNFSPATSKQIRVRLNAAPSLAELRDDMPAFAMAGQSCEVHFSGASDADGDPVSYTVQSLSTGLSVSPDTPVAAGAPVTLTLPDAATLDSLSWLAVTLRVRDDFGGESTKSYSIGGVGYVDTPRITSPPHGATGVLSNSPIVVSPFSVHADLDTPDKLDVQVARDGAFSDIVWEYSGADATQVVPVLPLETVLYIRARRFGQVLACKSWSDTVQITTVSPSISEPVIEYPAPRATGVALNPVVRISTPVCVEQTWEKVQCRVIQGDTTVYDSGELDPVISFDTSGVTAIESPHSVEVRVCGSLTGWGAWKNQPFTTLQVYLQPPVVHLPENGVDPTTVTITVDAPEYVGQAMTGGMTVRLAPTLQGLEEEQATQLWKPEASTTFAIPNCQYNTGYYVAAWWQGAITGVAKSVSSVPFTTMAEYVRKPEVRGVTEGEVDVLPIHSLTIDAFASVPEGYYAPHPDGSLCIQYKYATSNALIHDSAWIADTPTYTLPVALPVDTPVYVSVHRRGLHEAVTLLSGVARIQFTTINAFVPVPVFTSPVSGATTVAINPVLTLQTPQAVGQSVSKMEVQVSTAADFGTIVWTSGEVACADSIKAAVTGVNTTYYVRARYLGSVTGWTGWSTAVRFTTMVQASWMYTGNTSFTAPVAGRYAVEVHGGHGGGTSVQADPGGWGSSSGGTGGKALKTFTLAQGGVFSIVVGGNGSSASAKISGNCGSLDMITKAVNACRISGGSGGTTSFGSSLSASGGGGGRNNPYVSGGCPSWNHPENGGHGQGYGGDTNVTGGSTGPKCMITFMGA